MNTEIMIDLPSVESVVSSLLCGEVWLSALTLMTVSSVFSDTVSFVLHSNTIEFLGENANF